jgi:thiol peroxidase
MAQIKLKGNPINTKGELPKVGSTAPAFKLARNDLSEATLQTYAGKRKMLNIFPSLDTAVCALSVKRFNKEAANLPNTVVLCISADLPFAQKRFCGIEGITNAETLSTFRGSFARDYNLEITDGSLAGLCSRVVILLDENNKVLYSQQVPDITEEPDYEKALAAVR